MEVATIALPKQVHDRGGQIKNHKTRYLNSDIEIVKIQSFVHNFLHSSPLVSKYKAALERITKLKSYLS